MSRVKKNERQTQEMLPDLSNFTKAISILTDNRIIKFLVYLFVVLGLPAIGYVGGVSREYHGLPGQVESQEERITQLEEISENQEKINLTQLSMYQNLSDKLILLFEDLQLIKDHILP